MKECSLCGLPKPLSDFHERNDRGPGGRMSQCEACRSKVYFKRRYPVPCGVCSEHRRLDSNGNCQKCNELQGLRQCKKCRNLLAVSLQFYGHKTFCKDCLGGLPKSRRRGLGRR